MTNDERYELDLQEYTHLLNELTDLVTHPEKYWLGDRNDILHDILALLHTTCFKLMDDYDHRFNKRRFSN